MSRRDVVTHEMSKPDLQKISYSSRLLYDANDRKLKGLMRR